MIILIAGSSHTGKTCFAQRLLERYGYPYLSIDHLKMGLIRSGVCPLTPESSDGALTAYLWPIVAELIKTAIENGQNLIVEGCYIPFDLKDSFEAHYLTHIRYVCLIFSAGYIDAHFEDILRYANTIEHRLDDSGCTSAQLKDENSENLALCKQHGLDYLLIDTDYQVAFDFGLN